MILEGKRVAFLGDSITEGTGVTDQNNRYDNVLKKICNLGATFNYGIGGSRLAHQMVPSEKPRYDLCFCGRAFNIDKSAEIIVVYGGVNDYIHGDAPIGKKGDTTPATFHGAVYYLMNILRELYPKATVVFMTPARSCLRGVTDEMPSPRPMKKPCAMPTKGYVDIILEAAKEFGIPTLNLYDDLGINPNIPEDYEKYTIDGLHFNDAAHIIIADKLKALLESI